MTTYDIREVLPGVFRIPVPLEGNPLKELNSYLFLGSREAGTRNLLVDTGFRTEGCKKALLEGLAQLGVSMEDTDILLTHLHADHSGNAPGADPAGWKGIYQPGGLPVYGWNPAGTPVRTVPGKRDCGRSFAGNAGLYAIQNHGSAAFVPGLYPS